MNRAERRQQKKGPKQNSKATVEPKPFNSRAIGRRPERGLTRHISQQKGRGS